jgi:hypothetical protein
MVEGLARFADHFKKFTDQYVLIGGAACDLAMQAAAQTFRVTKDLDIVLCLESLSGAFVESFWRFVRDGVYQSQEREGGRQQFYRFKKPRTSGFPAMLELFARAPDALHFVGQGRLTPIPMTEGISSLSAILLDSDYYGWIQAGKQVQQDVGGQQNSAGLVEMVEGNERGLMVRNLGRADLARTELLACCG